MNNEQKEVISWELDNEKDVLRKLRKNYNQAIKDIQESLLKLEKRDQIQAVLYQEEYLTAQLNEMYAVLEILNMKNIKTIEEFLKTAYSDGFNGTLYDLSKNIAKVVIPVNMTEVETSVKYTAKHVPLSKLLYANVNNFAQAIQQSVSAGVIGAQPWRDVAIRIASTGQTNMKHAFLIARTEGARVQSEAALSAQKKAKKEGLDIVKQWDATMDSRTRPDHVILDGQVREINEKYEVNGHKTMAPCMFGIASEDIQCRCKSITRIRSEVSPNRKKLNQKNDKTIDTDDSKSYKAWKKRYGK